MGAGGGTMIEGLRSMALPISPRDPVAFTPFSYDGKDNPPVYLVSPATRRQRIAFRRALTAAGARYPSDLALMAALREGIAALLPAAELGPLLALIDGAEAITKAGEILDPAARANLEEIERAVAESDPRYRALLADRSAWLEIAPLTAASMFLVGRAGEAPLPRRGGIVPDEVLEALPEADIDAIGFKALALMSPTKDEEKNSASPASPPPSPRPSQATSLPSSQETAGTSSESITP
jgi:hypothetical protein